MKTNAIMTVQNAPTRRPTSVFHAMTSARRVQIIVAPPAPPATAVTLTFLSFTATPASINASMVTTVTDRMQTARSVTLPVKHVMKHLHNAPAA